METQPIVASQTAQVQNTRGSTLHFRADAPHLKVWWQLCDTPAVREYAGWGWFVVPVLTIPDFDTYLQQEILDLIGTLQEDQTIGTVIRNWGSQF